MRELCFFVFCLFLSACSGQESNTDYYEPSDEVKEADLGNWNVRNQQSNDFDINDTPTYKKPPAYEGEAASPKEFPWQARIQVFFRGQQGSRWCGATLIADQWVITSASCVTPNASLVMTYLGKFDISITSEPDEMSQPSIGIHIHPNYDERSYNYDFALIKLNSPIRNNSAVRPIQLANDITCQQNQRTGIDSCILATTTGWNSSAFTTLRKGQLPLLTAAGCQESWTRIRGLLLSPAKMCAGGNSETTKTDSCVGDQGGPVICQNPQLQRTFLIGVISHGELSCSKFSPENPAIYNRLCAALPWIYNFVRIRRESTTSSTIATTQANVAVRRIPASGALFANPGFTGASFSNTACPNVPMIQNGYIDEGSLTVGATRSVVCNTGFALSGANVIVCYAYGIWSQPGICIPVATGVSRVDNRCIIPRITYGYFIDPNGVTLPEDSMIVTGTTVRLYCLPSFSPTGNEVYYCINGGSFSPRVGSCTAQATAPPLQITCGSVPYIANGYIVTGASTVKSTRRVGCNQGYVLNGAASISCQNSATWSQPGICSRVITCDSLPRIQNGFVVNRDSTSATVGASRTCACNSGYYLDGPYVIICQPSGQWSTPGQCRPMTSSTWPTTPNRLELIERQQGQLCDAAANGDMQQLQNLIRLGYLDMNWRDRNQKTDCRWQNFNSTAIHRATACNRSEAVIGMLVNAGANVNLKEDYQGKVPLAIVAGNGNPNMVYYLVNQGASVNARDNVGNTALIYAATAGHIGTVSALVERGCDINARSAVDGRTAMHVASNNGHTPVVFYLAERGADIDLRDNEGRTALMLAAANGKTETVRVLLSKGAGTQGCSMRGCSVN